MPQRHSIPGELEPSGLVSDFELRISTTRRRSGQRRRSGPYFGLRRFGATLDEARQAYVDVRQGVDTGSGFERVVDGRWFHRKSGAIVSESAVEQLDLETLRILLAISFVGGTAMDARVTRRFQETNERIRELEEKVQDRQRFF